jgi:hypothetical protein
MAGTVGYAVKVAKLDGKFAGEKVLGYYSTYENALNRAEQLAGGNLRKMVTDMTIPNWWWNSEISIAIDPFTFDEDID